MAVPYKTVGTKADIRPTLISARNAPAGIIKSHFVDGGDYVVTYRTRFGERRVLRGLNKLEASASVSNLRSRGYKAEYRLADFI